MMNSMLSAASAACMPYRLKARALGNLRRAYLGVADVAACLEN